MGKSANCGLMMRRLLREHIMNMRMILHLPAPGMENAKESGSIARKTGRLCGECGHGLGCCLKQRRIGKTLMRAEEIPELRGNCIGIHEVVNGHQPVHPCIEPVDSLLTLTGRTMAVAA